MVEYSSSERFEYLIFFPISNSSNKEYLNKQNIARLSKNFDTNQKFEHEVGYESLNERDRERDEEKRHIHRHTYNEQFDIYGFNGVCMKCVPHE